MPQAVSKTYNEMKSSGVEWIREIPRHWRIARIRNFFHIVSGDGFPVELQGNTDGDFPFCKASDISIAGHFLTTAQNWVSKTTVSEHKYSVIPQGSILFAKIGEAMKKNHRTVALRDCCVDNNCQALIPVKVHTNFSYYLLCCIDMRWFDNAGTIPCVNNQKLKDCKICMPSFSEQTNIAEYLDKKCAAINIIIAEAKATIEEYKAWKASVIFEVVTKGLDPNSEMKDSGVEWIGKIPSGWSVTKLGAISSGLRNGYVGPTRNLFTDTGIKYIQSLHIKDGGINFDKHPYFVSGEWGELHPKIKENDLLIVQTGDIGQVGLVSKEYDGCNCHAVIIASPITAVISPKYLMYFLLSHAGKELLLSFQTGALLPHLNAGKIKDVPVVLPPLDDQEAIVSILDRKCAAIDAIIAEKEALIADMESYKKSLIFETVTGKRRVV